MASKAAALEAVRSLDVPLARRLLDERPSLISATDRNGLGLLAIACSASPSLLGVPPRAAVRMADLLLGRGLDIEAKVGKDRCTPLFFAVARGRNPTLVRYLIRRGALPSRAPGGALFAAGWWGDLASLRLLLDAGAEIDVVVGVTPFLACWCSRRFEAAKYLARRGADVDFRDGKGRTALHHGLEKEYDPALLRWLVRHGASPDIADRDGVTARARAARKRDRRWLAALG